MAELNQYDISSQNESCEKNKKEPSHHGNFHAVKDFSARQLPEFIKQKINPEMAKVIENMSKHVVRIAVMLNQAIEYGSGKIEEIKESDQGLSTIVVRTASHVLDNMVDFREVHIWLNYDSVDGDVIQVQGITKIQTDSDNDICTFECEIQSARVKEVNSDIRVYKILLNKYRMERDKNKSVALVSHPHGCCKYISIGELVARDASVGMHDLMKYTTATCPGSSGGFGMYFGSAHEFVHSRYNTSEGLGPIIPQRN